MRLVTAAMPPTFSERPVPAEGSMRFATALKVAAVPVELHGSADGIHGAGLGGSDPALAAWPGLLEHWMRACQLPTVNVGS